MMTSRLLAALGGLLLCLAALPARADLKVVASVPDLAALAQAVGGEHAQVTALAMHTQDPHFVDARPNLALALNRADLLVVLGLEMEVGWLPTLQLGARNARIQTGNTGFLDASRFVKLLEIPILPVVDRSQGDVHPGGNPHYLHDPRAALAVARGIATKMQQLDPENAQAYQDNLEKFTAQVEAARVDWERRLEGLKGTPVIGYHMTMAYLANWLGFTTIAYLEPKPGIPPNPAHVAKVLALGRQRKARLLLQEEYYPDTTSKLVASKVPASLVVLPGGTNFAGGQTYLQRMETLVSRLEKGLRARGN